MKYNRILLKLSGEALLGNDQTGISEQVLMEYAKQIAGLSQLGVEIGIVIGGGNIFRGLSGTKRGFDRVKGDYMGMLATVINSLAIHSALEAINCPSRLFTAIRMEPVGQLYNPLHVKEALLRKEVVVFGGGTGNPFFTTDTAAALRAVEIGADVLFKGTRVDGVYNADPEKNPDAVKYQQISFEEAINKNLKVMDLTAFSLCKENNMPIIVFDMNKSGNLNKEVSGQLTGTLVS